MATKETYSYEDILSSIYDSQLSNVYNKGFDNIVKTSDDEIILIDWVKQVYQFATRSMASEEEEEMAIRKVSKGPKKV